MSTSPRKNARVLLSAKPRENQRAEPAAREAGSAARPSGTDPSQELCIYSSEPGYAVAVTGRCLIHLVVDRTTSTTVSLVRRALADLSERYDTFGYLCVLEPGAHLTLPADLRESIHAYVRRYSTRFTGAAIVFEAPGFQATVVRSLVTAVNLASRASHPTKVFEDLRAGTHWLCRLTPGEPTVSRLLQFTEQLRKAK